MFVPTFDLQFALAAAVALIAGLVRGFSGFGSALLMSPMLAVLYGPVTAAVSVLLIDFAGVLQLLPMVVRQAEKRVVFPLACGGIIGIPVGASLLVSLDPDLIRRSAAIVVLAFVVILAWGWQYKGRRTFGLSALTGGLSGLMGGVAGFAGPPVILYFLSGQDNAWQIRASISGFFTVTATVTLLSYLYARIVTPEILTRAVWLIPLFMAGIYVGSRLFGLATEKTFRRVALILLTAVGLTALLA